MKFLKVEFTPPSKIKLPKNFWVPIHSPTHSIEIQRLLFKHGYYWVYEETEPLHLNAKLLHIYDKRLTYYGDDTYINMLGDPSVSEEMKQQPKYTLFALNQLLN